MTKKEKTEVRGGAANVGKSFTFLLPVIEGPQSSIKRVRPSPNCGATHWEHHRYLQEPHTRRPAAGGEGRVQPGLTALSEGCKR